MPPRVRIRAVAIGIRMLSFNFGRENSSMIVANKDVINVSTIVADDIRDIIT